MVSKYFFGWVGGKMNPRIRLTSAKVEVGVEVEAELGKKKTEIYKKEVKRLLKMTERFIFLDWQ